METVAEKNVLPLESYVVEIDGKIRSAYGIFVEALKAGLELKQKFPHSQSKCMMQNTVASKTECRSIEDNVSDTANGLNDADWRGRRVLSSQAKNCRGLQARIDCSSGGANKIRPGKHFSPPLQ